MDQERIKKVEETIEGYLFGNVNTTEYALRKAEVMTLYLIYQQLKELNNNLSLIDEAISSSK
ncbi:MAG: hypothetical protein NV1_21 [Nanoarchaeotal virus 1]|nr:MAG: hypothetical protein NV1_21 [Nanoarchaeotal virus 1]